MQVDDSGCDDQSGRIRHLLGVASLEMADLCDPAILDTDVGLVRRQPCPIDNRPTFDQLIELCHGSLRVLTLSYSISSILGSHITTAPLVQLSARIPPSRT